VSWSLGLAAVEEGTAMVAGEGTAVLLVNYYSPLAAMLREYKGVC